MTKISAVEKGRINKIRYAEYIAELEATGKKFSLNQHGEVNISAISYACGFNRQVLSKNASMKAKLEKDIIRIGTDIHHSVDNETRLAKKAAEKSQESSRLHRELDSQTQANYSLRDQIDELQKHVRELEGRDDELDIALDEMLSNGRRFTL